MNLSGDFQCGLFALKGTTRTSGNLLAADTKNELSTDWWNRGRMRAAQLRGECLKHPEYSTDRRFKLRGMLLTLRIADVKWSTRKDGLYTAPSQAGTCTVKAQSNTDPNVSDTAKVTVLRGFRGEESFAISMEASDATTGDTVVPYAEQKGPELAPPFALATQGTYQRAGNFTQTTYSMSATGNGPPVSQTVNGGEYSGSVNCSAMGATSGTGDATSELDMEVDSGGEIDASPVAGMQFSVSGSVTGGGKVDSSVLVEWSDGGVVDSQLFSPTSPGTVKFSLTKSLSAPASVAVTFGSSAECGNSSSSRLNENIGGSYDVTIFLSQ